MPHHHSLLTSTTVITNHSIHTKHNGFTSISQEQLTLVETLKLVLHLPEGILHADVVLDLLVMLWEKIRDYQLPHSTNNRAMSNISGLMYGQRLG